MENEKYIKGFNHAFLLAEHRPKLIKKIIASKSKNDYIKGIIDGEASYSKSKIKTRSQDLKSIHTRKDRSRDKGLER